MALKCLERVSTRRILHVVGGMGLGGTETFLMNIYRNIDKEKIQFDFIVYERNRYNNFYEEEIRKLGGKIFYLSNPTIKKPLESIFEIKKIIKENEYKAVHTHTKYNSGLALFTAWLLNVEVRVAHSHNTGGADKSYILSKVYQKVMFWMINFFATSFSACSEKAAQHLFIKKNIKNKYQFIPNAVDFNPFLDLSFKGTKCFKESLGIPKNANVIGHIGRYGKAKNHEFIVEMFEQLLKMDQNFHLVLIGDGPKRVKIQETVEERGISSHVKILGQRDDVSELMGVMDVFILPSLYEGLGIVLLEAQAAGLPCVVSENIQPEADMGIGLMNWVSLNDLNGWVNTIIKQKKNKIYNKDIIRDIIHQSPYVLSNVVNKFYKLYDLEELIPN